MFKFAKIFAMLVLIAHIGDARSWGKLGHEASAIIASNNLSTAAKNKIFQLIGSHDLRESSLWPDVVRQQNSWAHTKPFHFTSVRDGSNYFESLEQSTLEERVLGDAIRAVVKAEDTLRSASSTKVDRIFALKFLVHLIGDIHQPLHTGRPEDKGGNLIALIWFGRKDNLHSVWDTGILKVGLEGAPAWNPELSEDPFFYVSTLPKVNPRIIKAWQAGSFLQWHDESMFDRSHSYMSANMNNQDVVKRYKILVDERVMKAGYRLAHMLNSIFENRVQSTEGKELRRKLALSLGPQHAREISLRPGSFDFGVIKPISQFECDHE